MTLLKKLYKAEAEQSSSRDTGFCFWRQKAETRALSALMTSALSSDFILLSQLWELTFSVIDGKLQENF